MASAMRRKQHVVPSRVELPAARIDEMLNGLSSPDPRVREEAASGFRSVREPRAAGRLRILINDGDLRVRIAAAEALHNQGDSSGVPTLIAILGGRADSDIRCLAGRALGNIGDRRAVRPLIEAVRTSDRTLQAYAAEALGRLGEPASGEALLELAERGRGRARVSAIRALGAVGATGERAQRVLAQALERGDLQTRIAAAQVLTSWGGPGAVQALIENLDYSQGGRDRDPDRPNAPAPGSYGVRNACVEALAAIAGRNPQVIVSIIGALGDRRENVRMNAAKALGRIGSDRATMELAGLVLSDRDEYVRMAAAEALGRIGDGRAVPALIERVGQNSTSEESARSIAAAAEALGSLQDARAFTALMDALTDRSEIVRTSAVRALGALGDRRAIPALNSILLNDPFPHLRAEAAIALGRLGGIEARNALERALGDAHPSVRLAAQRALDSRRTGD